MIQKYTQSTYETCLSCCLLQGVGRINRLKITKELELECLMHSLKTCKDDFVTGHLDFISKKFNVGIKRFVDNKPYFDFINSIGATESSEIEIEPINVNLVDMLLGKDACPILYIDSYFIYHVYHYPHFVTVLKKEKGDYSIFDTWDGKEKIMTEETMKKAIASLRDHIMMCPQIILIEKTFLNEQKLPF